MSAIPRQPAKPDEPAAVAPAKAKRKRHILRWLGVSLLVLIVLLVIARLLLPYYLRDYVDRTLDQSPDYDGQIGEVHVHLWRGAYAIDNVQIVKTQHAVPVPFFESPRVEFSLDWSSLMHGEARGMITMESPKLNFVHAPSPEETQTGVDQPWLAIIDDLFPFRIDKAQINNGEVHFHAFHTSPRVNVYLNYVQATMWNLTNVEDRLDPLMARVWATGMAMESGYFQFDMSFNPNEHLPTFNLAAQVLELDVTQLNELTKAYGEFDFERGHFDFVLELSAKNGEIEGYAKPLFRNLQVISLRDLKSKDPLRLFWEALVGVVGEVFQNQPRNQFGTRFALSGDLHSPKTNFLEVIGNVLRNAFVQAYLPRIEGTVAPETVHAPDEVEK